MAPVEHAALPLPKAQGRVLRQEVLDAVRAAILDGTMGPGSRVLEAQIASSMGVSRAPVREAIRQLEQEGLIEFFPHKGAIVVGLPEDEIDVIYELRSQIEERAIARVAQNPTAEGIARLEGALAEIQDVRRSADPSKVAETDVLFHRTLVELSGFRLLLHIWTSMDGLVRARTYRALADQGGAQSFLLSSGVHSHRELIEAIRSGDPEAAARAARAHIMDVRDRLSNEAGAAAGPGPAAVGGHGEAHASS